MEKIKQAIESLESKNNSFFATEEGKKILSSLNLLKNELKSHDFITKKTCDHNLEDICAYTENQLTPEEYIAVDKIISECDSCFETYYQLKEIYEEVVKTPERVKNKVKDTESIKKNLFSSVLKKLKANFVYTGSGVLVGFATALFMFFVILPNKQNIELKANSNGLVFNSVGNVVENELFLNAMEEKKKGNLDLAIEKLETFIEKNPDSIEAEFELAKIYKTQNKPMSSKRHFEEYLKKANKLKLELEKNISEANNEVKP